jgi:hypothetical protein
MSIWGGCTSGGSSHDGSGAVKSGRTAYISEDTGSWDIGTRGGPLG